MIDRKAYTAAEARVMLTLGESKFRQLCADGSIRTVRVGRRVLVPATAIDTFLNGGTARKVS